MVGRLEEEPEASVLEIHRQKGRTVGYDSREGNRGPLSMIQTAGRNFF